MRFYSNRKTNIQTNKGGAGESKCSLGAYDAWPWVGLIFTYVSNGGDHRSQEDEEVLKRKRGYAARQMKSLKKMVKQLKN
ncbi:hypothetical protein EVAR_14674_1 [Eumeta japonica]|uniref:Uncharacterized protein n=1 Tax=Eumeta variegata TaxID=151549 RepID=A0A4C1U241_EUMVA|nr:hypothetical protein EVAR_14674_1 [Eumeta japonica]